ncbi:desmoglein-2-like protein [Clarias gariepinus]|uniref:desmoglein-2-like protein n=1 Tax=Clarias gariepinus TaxID=13013 RepID=UPI00234D8056|nr:desmoglein-2-like protein [Clarias gariepinus]
MATLLTFYLIAMICTTVIWVQGGKEEMQIHHREKRAWVIPPTRLMENVDYTNKEYIAKIRSDEETRTDIVYSLIGPSVVEGLFSVDKTNGFVRIHGILDREKTATYELKGRAALKDGTLVEKDLDLKIIVLDQNDNAPEFKYEMIGSVDELSDKDTHVIAITAFDADEQGKLFSKIAYKVIQQEPAGEIMFRIERSSGEINVKLNTLDRETQDTYKLIITATDLDGGYSDSQNIQNTGTGTVTINLRDVNDNIPELEKESYEGSVKENIMNVEAIRIKAVDKDQIYTSNWEAVFSIISGNEAGHFSISTDPKTNEGILVVDKKLDFEELNEVNLIVVVNNKSPYHKSVVIEKPITYPIKIKVMNVPEAPHFNPAVKVVSISEDRTTIDLKKVIATYTATDSDTLLTATNVRYLKGEDVDNWLSINEKTGEIRLKKYPDRESKFLTDGTYYPKILCITNERSPKTATGTLAIQVQDFNDHCPLLTHSVETLCYGNSVMYVTATDGDKYPNAEPFEFRVVAKGTKETWSVERLNETTVILRSQEDLWPGYHTVELEVLDQQGKSCQGQKLQVTVCKCTEAQVCQPLRKKSTPILMGAGGVLALLLGILLLLFIPMFLLFCECGGAAALGKFQEFPFDINQKLIPYHTEGQGEYKELEVLSQPSGSGGGGGSSGRKLGGGERRRYGDRYEEESWNGWSLEEIRRMLEQRNTETILGGHSELITSRTLDSMALSESYLRSYFAKKSQDTAKQEVSVNHLLVSNYETCNSVTGSLEDICSHLHKENNLDFLNDLGPQFKRLAEISYGSSFAHEESSISTSPTSSSKVTINVKDAAGGVHTKGTSSSSSTTTNITKMYSTGGATSLATIGQTLLIQQPMVYMPSTPMYVVEQQQPTLLLTSGPVLGVQKSNVVLVEKGTTNIAIPPHSTLPRPGLQQANTRVVMDEVIGGTVIHGKSVQESNMVLVEKEATNIAISPQSTLPRLGLKQANTRVDQGIRGTVVHGISGNAEHQGTVSGTVHVVETRRVESTEPVHVVQSSSHSRINNSTQAKGQNGGVMALRSAPVVQNPISLSRQDAPLFAASNGSTHQEVREERVSVVEGSFQSSSTS